MDLMIPPPGLVPLLFGLVFWILPLVALGWALVALHRLKSGQQAIRMKLESIERQLQGGRHPG